MEQSRSSIYSCCIPLFLVTRFVYAYIVSITNSQGLLYIGIINSTELVSSSARVTSAKFQPKVFYIETPGPIDRTPGTPGSGKNDELCID